MKKFIVPLVLLLLLGLGQSVRLYSQEITVRVDENNLAEVKEVFRLGLDSGRIVEGFDDTEVNVFNMLATSGGDNVERWTEFHERIKPSVRDYSDMKISTSRRQNVYEVILSYKVPELVELKDRVGRIESYGINFELFEFHVAGTGLIIPDNTDLWVDLPDSLDAGNVHVSPDPVSRFAGFEYRWNTGVWDINIEYSKTEPISAWTFEGTLRSFRETFVGNPAYGIALVVLIALALIYRKHIKNLFSEGLVVDQDADEPKKSF